MGVTDRLDVVERSHNSVSSVAAVNAPPQLVSKVVDASRVQCRVNVEELLCCIDIE